MIPPAFDYIAPQSLDEAVRALAAHGEEAKLLAGGHSLLPLLKLRLANPKLLIDLSKIPGLSNISQQDDKIVVGALTTHYQIESSALLKTKCPLLPQTARAIGDVQVRNRGTIGGSLAHADPSADWPAAILALGGELKLSGPKRRATNRGRRILSRDHDYSGRANRDFDGDPCTCVTAALRQRSTSRWLSRPPASPSSVWPYGSELLKTVAVRISVSA